MVRMRPLLRIACRITIAIAASVLHELEPEHRCHWTAWESEMGAWESELAEGGD